MNLLAATKKVAVGQLLVFSDIYSKMTHEGVKNSRGYPGSGRISK